VKGRSCFGQPLRLILIDGQHARHERGLLDAYMDAPVCQTMFLSFRPTGTESASSGRVHRSVVVRLVLLSAGQQRPDNARVLVRQGHRSDIGMALTIAR